MRNRPLLQWAALARFAAVVQSKGGTGVNPGDRAESGAEPLSDAPMIIAIVASVLFSVVVTICVCRHIARRRSHRAHVARHVVEPSRAHVDESRVCREWFQKSDVDGSGKIDVKELKARP